MKKRYAIYISFEVKKYIWNCLLSISLEYLNHKFSVCQLKVISLFNPAVLEN